MVTSGGVKAYVDTAVTPLNTDVSELETKVDTLKVVSISTAGASSSTSTNSVAFTTANFVTGVEDVAHNLERASTYKMKTPTGGVSMLSVNISFIDQDDSTDDVYTLTLYIDNTVVAQTTTSGVRSSVYANLCYNSYVLPNKEIKATFVSVSGAHTSYRQITAGSMTCVNYQ
tara:strand:- start:21 stop:536 length:516 start_codon:yes stop_codon:yes gene_type:complete